MLGGKTEVNSVDRHRIAVLVPCYNEEKSIAKVIADTIDEARREAPVRPSEEEQEGMTYSSDRGSEPAGRGDRGDRGQGGAPRGGEDEKRRRPRRRRAKPEAIAARLKTGAEGAVAEDAPESADAVDAGSADAE